ncbi:uncharacterized protein LOC129571478 [Sitodiplosis mosellana]|uniref:uncharacterized protein LOC129571478 n=1 Tax=Sitodiplosis mosellana TaxID=263140 RepID=UPI002443AB0B|nr:uncharacterized protein LOC129571478 [Sitodiplosis mosellana]
MACLSRLISLRESVREIFSDNATTFHGASNEMKLVFEHWEEVADECLRLKRIRWNFIAPLSPNQGGFWERAVRSAKNHLRRVIGTQILTFEEFATVLASVAACMNSRPLIALDVDPTACKALTPAHLVVAGRRLVGPIQFDYTSIPDNRLTRWRLIQKIAQEFWSRWHSEYVTQQIETSKWNEKKENIEVGDIVLVKHDNLPPTHWPLARVITTFPGDYGCVRNVEVKLGSSTFRRGINKIARLPIDDE